MKLENIKNKNIIRRVQNDYTEHFNKLLAELHNTENGRAPKVRKITDEMVENMFKVTKETK